jgi:hypothetical protein
MNDNVTRGMKMRGQSTAAYASVTALVLSAGLALGACTHDDIIDNDIGIGSDGGDDGGDGGINACATGASQATLAPLDILLLLDNSASMDYLGKWTSVEGAITSFVNNPQAVGLGLGLQYYPLRATCEVSDYATPAVAIQTLPTNSMQVVASMQSKQMSGGTPLVPAFEGVYGYLKDWATANPTHKVVMVLCSDGAPDDSCIAPSDMGEVNSLANATQLAMAAYTNAPVVSTFVIGVGSETSTLQQIATAGGGTAIFVDTSTDIQGAFLAALNAIRGNALSCQFPIPAAAPGQTLDYSEVNVQFTPAPGAATQTFVNVGSAAGCGMATNDGWYYDDPKVPTKVELCPGAKTIIF